MTEPKYYEVKAEVVSVKELKHNMITAILRSDEIAKNTKPGQFITIQVNCSIISPIFPITI